MPFYRVMLHGKGINVDLDDEWGPMIGFFTTRLVKADSAAEAEDKAKAMVLSEWSSGTNAEANKDMLPILSVESVNESTFVESLSFKNTGYSFYCEGEEQAKTPA